MVFARLVGAVSLLSFALNASAAPHLKARSSEVVKFEIDLTWDDVFHTGGEGKKGILVNGTSPGPVLKANLGDTVEFLVHNNMEEETTIHFHGISQAKTPWADGVPGVTQKAIQPGDSYLYKWEADEAGSFFYHAHFRSQIMDGLVGGIVIKNSADAPRPWSFISNDTEVQKQLTAADDALEQVFISDYVALTSEEFHDQEELGNIDIACADAIIINGKGSQYCFSQEEINALTSPRHDAILANVPSGQLTLKGCLPPIPATQGPNFQFNADAVSPTVYNECTPSEGEKAVVEVDGSKGWAALSFVGSSGFELLKFTIDGHKAWIYAVDGAYIVPQKVDQIQVNNGDRFSILLELNQTPGDYEIRVANQGLNQIISGYATLRYKGAAADAVADDSLAVMNFAGTNSTPVVTFAPPKAVPFPAREIAQTPDQTYIFHTKKLAGPNNWTLTGTESFNPAREDDSPLLFADPASIPDSELIVRTELSQWIDFIIITDGPLASPHPMHKHGNKAYVLGQGAGEWIWASVAEAQASGALPPTAFNLVNPPFRDGYTTTPNENGSSWMALRYEVEEAGAFLFHCHMQTHAFGGMAFAILDGVNEWPEVPEEYINGTGVSTKLSKKSKTHPL